MSNARMSVTGAGSLESALDAIAHRLAAASVIGVAASAASIREEIIASMGAPRWGHRGRSRIYSEQVNIGKQKGGASSGPMGKFTGAYAASVMTKATGTGTGAFGAVFLDPSKPGNTYKAGNEKKYPTFKPAALKGAASFRIACAKAWGMAL